MASVNRVILIGNLGKDPETRYLPSGDAVANFSIATTEKFKDKSGAQQEHTEWHRISFFGRQAEIAGEYLKKGSQVYIEGALRTRKWQDKEGKDTDVDVSKAAKMVEKGAEKGKSPVVTVVTEKKGDKEVATTIKMGGGKKKDNK